MALELEELLKRLDIPEDKIEEFKEGEAGMDEFDEHFMSTFVSRKKAPQDDEIIKAVEGSRLGSVTTKFKRVLGLEKGDVEGKKLEELIDDHVKPALEKQDELRDQIKELEKKKAGKSKKKVEELQDQIEKKEEKIDELSKKQKSWKEQYEELQNEFKSYKTDQTIQQKIDQARSQVPLKSDMSKLEKKGLEQEIESKYKFELDDEGNVVPKDRETDSPVWNDKETEKLGVKEIYEKEAMENDLLKVNDGGEEKKEEKKKKETVPSDDGKENHIHPDAAGWEDQIKQGAE